MLDSKNAPRRTAGTSTLDLALRALELLAHNKHPMALAEIAERLGATKPTIYRHLLTLQRHGFVRQDQPTGHYAAGAKLLILGEAVRGQFDITTTARPHLLNLRDKTGHSSTLCSLVGDDLIVLEMLEGRTIIDFGTPRGTRFDFHASAHGRVWLAFGPSHLAEHVLATPMKAWTPSTQTSAEKLKESLAQVKAQGWATAADEIVSGANALAAPVFNHRGEIVASVAIVGSTHAIPPLPSAEQIAAVLDCAQQVSAQLGWRPQI